MRRLALLAVFAGACQATPLPHATALDAERAGVAVAELDRGRTLLRMKCGGNCHFAPQPSERTAVEWPHQLDEMAGRANLQPDDRRLIELYLVTLARR